MKTDPLSRRERELMDIVYRIAPATVAQIRDEMADPPSYSTVRALMATLDAKGHVQHELQGRAYLYRARKPAEEAGLNALRRVVAAFFGGSTTQAAVALVQLDPLEQGELEALQSAVAQAAAEGR